MGGLGKRKRIHHTKQTKLEQPRSDINVTPLVDVVLVLLIIFMVITPMMSRGRDIKRLPKTQNHYELKDGQQPVIALDYDAKTDTYPVYYDKERLGELQEEGVKDRLADKIQRGWTKVKIVELQNRVYIKASAEIPYEKVYPLLMAINEMGVTSIDLGTNDKDK
ncbi:MAG: biopolymer transporter ExbD [Kofleriaceae bacterium]|jgi:biopolymer transport protein TolR|nr:biopolymer transporter ExbD [Kofleriaceae bacterium]MBP9166790.1 biopolymer transporter ExbD [Kofleriaceae bacterium]MBP9857106.1 biopolymer transporter ExbD [Kofleriaceae bacterium]